MSSGYFRKHVSASPRSRPTPPSGRLPTLCRSPNIDLIAVCDSDGRLVGVLTKTDIVGRIRTRTGCNCTTRVELVMTRDVIACRTGEWLQNIWSKMKETGLQRIPIVDLEESRSASYTREMPFRLS